MEPPLSHLSFTWSPPSDIAGLRELYETNGWSTYLRDWSATRRAIDSSHSLAAAESGTAVGLIRGVSDAETILYIQDLLVLPSRQHQGIGTRLLTMFLSKFASIGQVVLTSENTSQALTFYSKHGLIPMPATYGTAFIADRRQD